MKLIPNFSWQKYEGKPEDEKLQFYYQLQKQFIEIANSVNATIDDDSYFLKERVTSFLWVNNTPIYTKTLATVAWTSTGTINLIPLNIVGNFTVIDMVCCLSDGAVSTSNTVLLPHLDVTTAANSIEIVRNGTNIKIQTGGTNYSVFSGYVTVYYIKS